MNISDEVIHIDYLTQLFCECGWELEAGAVCKNECPECGKRLYYRKIKL